MHPVSFTSLHKNENLSTIICNQFLDGCTPKRKRRVTIGRTEEFIRKMEEERSSPKKKEKEVKLEDLFKSQTGTLEFIAWIPSTLEFTLSLQIPIRSVSLGHIFSYSAIYLKLTVACHHDASIIHEKYLRRNILFESIMDGIFWSNVSSTINDSLLLVVLQPVVWAILETYFQPMRFNLYRLMRIFD